MALVKQRDWFPTAKKDTVGRACIPVELKVSKRNAGEKWLELCCVDDIVPTAVVVAASSVQCSIGVVSNEDDSHNILIVFAEFYLLRSTGTTPVIAHPCYSLKRGIGLASHEDDWYNLSQ